ncbi:MAG: hypothetical protein WBB28_27175 [Crinalium sp.]
MNDLKQFEQLEKLPASREDRIQDLLNYIKENCDRPMSVNEFCAQWVRHSLVQKDYINACSTVLARAAGVSVFESYKWCKFKKAPKYLPLLLRLCDITKRIQAQGICRAESDASPFGDDVVKIPRIFPKPKFTWNTPVVVDGRAARVKMMGCENRVWWYTVEFENGERETLAESVIGVW